VEIPAGAHFQFGYTIRSSWENLASLSMVPGREGLYLRQPGVDSALLRGSTRLLEGATRAVGLPSMIGDEDALAEGRFIALMPFTHHLRSGALRRDLERWAPQLFTAAAA
jgi:hypothetical protein